jgi:hypothetical protein
LWELLKRYSHLLLGTSLNFKTTGNHTSRASSSLRTKLWKNMAPVSKQFTWSVTIYDQTSWAPTPWTLILTLIGCL